MPSRAKRQIHPGSTYHLISRLVDREWFISGDEERDLYLTLLGNAMSKSDWICLAYAIMSNHIHLAFVAGEQTLDSWIRRVHSPFAGWLNRKHDRIGSLFVRGPKDIETADINEVIAYIHNNPVRAGVVGAPRASTWTSHRAYLGLEPAPEWLHVDEGLRRAGFRDPKAFDAWVRDPNSDRPHIERVERVVKPLIVRSRPRDRHLAPLLVQATAAELAMPVLQLCSTRRSDAEVFARRVAVHCASLMGLTGVEIAAALAISQQAVSQICLKTLADDVQLVATRVLQRVVAANDATAKAA